MKRIIAFACLLLMASPAVAGVITRCQTQAVVTTGAYYYTAQPQAVQQYVAPADTATILNQYRSILQLKEGMDQLDQQMYQQRLIRAQQMLAPNTQGIQAAPLLGKAEQIIEAKCAKCHSGQSPSGGASIINNGFISADWSTPKGRRVIIGYISANDMPPAPAAPLSDEEAQTLLEWARGK